MLYALLHIRIIFKLQVQPRHLFLHKARRSRAANGVHGDFDRGFVVPTEAGHILGALAADFNDGLASPLPECTFHQSGDFIDEFHLVCSEQNLLPLPSISEADSSALKRSTYQSNKSSRVSLTLAFVHPIPCIPDFFLIVDQRYYYRRIPITTPKLYMQFPSVICSFHSLFPRSALPNFAIP